MRAPSKAHLARGSQGALEVVQLPTVLPLRLLLGRRLSTSTTPRCDQLRMTSSLTAPPMMAATAAVSQNMMWAHGGLLSEAPWRRKPPPLLRTLLPSSLPSLQLSLSPVEWVPVSYVPLHLPALPDLQTSRILPTTSMSTPLARTLTVSSMSPNSPAVHLAGPPRCLPPVVKAPPTSQVPPQLLCLQDPD